MAEFSKELLDMLTEFMICEIGSKALDGITYQLLLKDDKDKETYERYLNIKQEAVKCGYAGNEVFRVYEVCNGYIFDMDLVTVKKITNKMAMSIKNLAYEPNIINNMPEKRRKKDIFALGKYLMQEFNNGKSEVEVALFSRNTTNKIVINADSKNGDALVIRYNAYAIRHWDIELINEKILIPNGIRVSRIQPCEILPSKTGVSFIFTMEKLNEREDNTWEM